MKAFLFTVAICCCAADASAQKQSEALPYNKQQLDSLFRHLPNKTRPFVLPDLNGRYEPENIVGENDFAATHPGAVVINRTQRGTIYTMPLDNMAVLVPAMNQVEKMPVNNAYRHAPADKMPNPMAPLSSPEKKGDIR